jgi:hypothetical protein
LNMSGRLVHWMAPGCRTETQDGLEHDIDHTIVCGRYDKNLEHLTSFPAFGST